MGDPRRPEDDVLGQLLPAFDGTDPPTWLLRRVAEGQAHGVTVFLRANARDADSLASLAWQLHGAAPDDLPLLIGADQEGGQLVGPRPRDHALPGRHGPRRSR